MKRPLLFLLLLLLVGAAAFQIGKQKVSVLGVSPDLTQKEEGVFNCPYNINGGVYSDYVKSINEVKVVGAPQLIDNPQIIKLNKPYSQQEFEKGLYKIGAENGWRSGEFDVDGDGKDETIINASVAMTHQPHIAAIVKEGNIVFETGGANIWIEEVYGNQGFLLKVTIDWNTGEEKWTRYVSKDGGFMPVWTQKVCWVNFE